MPSASKIQTTTATQTPQGDVRCDLFTDKRVLCDHLLLRNWTIVCPSCREQHRLADVIKEARRNGANIDNLLREVFQETPKDFASEINQANLLAQKILRPLKSRLRAIPCKLSADLERLIITGEYKLVRIAGGLDLDDILKAHGMLAGDNGQTWSIWPQHWDYGSQEFDDVTIGRDLRLNQQPRTYDHFVLWKPGKVSDFVSVNFDLSSKKTLDEQFWEQFRYDHRSELLNAKTGSQVPCLNDFLFALLIERISQNDFSDQEQWVLGAHLKVVDQDGKERTGSIVSLHSTERRPDSMVIGVKDWRNDFREPFDPKDKGKKCYAYVNVLDWHPIS